MRCVGGVGKNQKNNELHRFEYVSDMLNLWHTCLVLSLPAAQHENLSEFSKKNLGLFFQSEHFSYFATYIQSDTSY